MFQDVSQLRPPLVGHLATLAPAGAQALAGTSANLHKKELVPPHGLQKQKRNKKDKNLEQLWGDFMFSYIVAQHAFVYYGCRETTLRATRLPVGRYLEINSQIVEH